MTNKVKKIQEEKIKLHEAAEEIYPIEARLEGANHFIEREAKKMVNYIHDSYDLKEKILKLEDELNQQKFCYELTAKRAKKYKAQLTIIREALNMETI